MWLIAAKVAELKVVLNAASLSGSVLFIPNPTYEGICSIS